MYLKKHGFLLFILKATLVLLFSLKKTTTNISKSETFYVSFFFNLSKREQVPLKWSGVQTDVSSCTNYLFLLTYIFAEALTPLTKYPHLFLFTRKCICLTITLVVLNSSIWMYLPKLKLANDIRTLSKYVIAGSIACSI